MKLMVWKIISNHNESHRKLELIQLLISIDILCLHLSSEFNWFILFVALRHATTLYVLKAINWKMVHEKNIQIGILNWICCKHRVRIYKHTHTQTLLYTRADADNRRTRCQRKYDCDCKRQIEIFSFFQADCLGRKIANERRKKRRAEPRSCIHGIIIITV